MRSAMVVMGLLSGAWGTGQDVAAIPARAVPDATALVHIGLSSDNGTGLPRQLLRRSGALVDRQPFNSSAGEPHLNSRVGLLVYRLTPWAHHEHAGPPQGRTPACAARRYPSDHGGPPRRRAGRADASAPPAGGSAADPGGQQAEPTCWHCRRTRPPSCPSPRCRRSRPSTTMSKKRGIFFRRCSACSMTSRIRRPPG